MSVSIKIRSRYLLNLEAKPSLKVCHLEDGANIGFDFSIFNQLKLKLLVKEKEEVAIGQPLVEDKTVPGRAFVSLAGGVIEKIIRGDKRKIECIVIKKAEKEKALVLAPINCKSATRAEILRRLCDIGAFMYIRRRPCDVLASPLEAPRSIFVQGLESAPFIPKVEMQLEGIEDDFIVGLTALSKIAPVHLVVEEKSPLANICIDGVTLHFAKGPHPVANPSLHIEKIDPIMTEKDIVWTLKADLVAYIGRGIEKGEFLLHQMISIAGEGVKASQRLLYKVRRGSEIQHLLEGKLEENGYLVLRGNPLCGEEIDPKQQCFLRSIDFALSTLKEKGKTPYFHFCRGGINRFTFTKTYLYRLFGRKKPVSFSSLMHGEQRAFIDGSYYDKVMPLKILTMPLIRALLSSDYEKAVEFGLLEVAPEDFALASFICPSKIDHIGIVKKGLEEYASQYLLDS